MAAPDARYDILLSNERTLDAWDARDELLVSNHWTDVMLEEHAVGFTVARVANLDLLASIRASLDDVIRNGGTFEQWQANILPELKKHGWWGVVTDKAITGSDTPVIVNQRRLETIYRMNVKMSMAAGRWKRIQAQKDVLPYLRYLSDHFRKHPRQDHKSWHGLILHVDDPAWQWLFPPNGWGCNCRVQQLNQAMMDRRGWKVGTAPQRRERDFVRASTGEVIQVPEGVAPGFGYNPGTAHLQALADKIFDSVETAIARSNVYAAQQFLDDFIASPSLEQFVALPNGLIPLKILPPHFAAELGSSQTLLAINRGIAMKQNRNHPDLSAADYRLLPAVLEGFIVRLKQKTGEIVVFSARDHQQEGKLWKAVLQFNGTDRYPVLLSFQRTDQRELRRKLAEEGITILEDKR